MSSLDSATAAVEGSCKGVSATACTQFARDALDAMGKLYKQGDGLSSIIGWANTTLHVADNNAASNVRSVG